MLTPLQSKKYESIKELIEQQGATVQAVEPPPDGQMFKGLIRWVDGGCLGCWYSPWLPSFPPY